MSDFYKVGNGVETHRYISVHLNGQRLTGK